MGLSTTPARGVEAAEACLCAIIHNGATFRRDMEIGYALDPVLVKRETAVTLDGLGVRRTKAKASGKLTLKAMEPGENRWVGVSFIPPTGRAGEIARVDFSELLDGAAINGFSLGVRLGSAKEALAHTIERHRSVFTRLAALGHDQAEVEVKAARAALRKPPTPAAWVSGVGERFDAIAELLVAAGADKARIDGVRKLLGGKPGDAQVALGCLLERADIALTMTLLAAGSRADVLQTARWQAELFDHGKPFAERSRRRRDRRADHQVRRRLRRAQGGRRGLRRAPARGAARARRAQAARRPRGVRRADRRTAQGGRGGRRGTRAGRPPLGPSAPAGRRGRLITTREGPWTGSRN